MLRFLKVIAVTNTKNDVDPAGILGRKVRDGTVRNSTIRNNDCLVVSGRQYRTEDLNLVDNTHNASGIDKVTHFVGPKYKNQDTTREISQRALQSQTDSQACRTQDCDK